MQFLQTLNREACQLETTFLHSQNIKSCKPAGPWRQYRLMSGISFFGMFAQACFSSRIPSPVSWSIVIPEGMAAYHESDTVTC